MSGWSRASFSSRPTWSCSNAARRRCCRSRALPPRTPPAALRPSSGAVDRGVGTSSAPPQQPADALLARPVERPTPPGDGPALRITVVNGDLTFVAEPLMLGHYRASKLTGTERVMNGLIGGAMHGALQRGLYPVTPGSQQVFVNTRATPRQSLAAAATAGGDRRRPRRRGEPARRRIWSPRCGRPSSPGRSGSPKSPAAPDFFTLAATLIGSGGTGISAGEVGAADRSRRARGQ